MSDQSDVPGGQGDGADAPKRWELKLTEQALRNDWGISPRARLRMLQRMVNLVDQDPDPEDTRSDPDDVDEPPMLPPAGGTKPRTAIAAMRVIVAICNLNLKQQALDLARERYAPKDPEFDLSQAVAKAEALALERKAERERDRERADHPTAQ